MLNEGTNIFLPILVKFFKDDNIFYGDKLKSQIWVENICEGVELESGKVGILR